MLIKIEKQSSLASKLYEELDPKLENEFFGGKPLKVLHSVWIYKTIHATIYHC